MEDIPVRKSKNSNMKQLLSISALTLSAALLITGCSVGSESVSLRSQGSASATLNAPNAYGDVLGSKKKVNTKNGTYEEIEIDNNSAVYEYEDQLLTFEDSAWTEQEVAMGQQFALKYITSEFLDSKAMESGDVGYRKWYEGTAKEYFSSTLYDDGDLRGSMSESILGNFAGVSDLPDFIHDGKPRVSNVELNVNNVKLRGASSNNETIDYVISYDADFRVDDSSAIEYGTKKFYLSKKEFLKKPEAKQLRDGKGENTFNVSGDATVTVEMGSNRQFKIDAFDSESNYTFYLESD